MKSIVAITLAIFALSSSALAQEAIDPPADPIAVEDPVDPVDPIEDPVIDPVDPEPELTPEDPAAPAPASSAPIFDQDDANELLALNSALSLPAWLEANERFSISGGVGFAEGATAFGATGIMRIDGNVSGFVGGAVSEGGEWAGKAGVRAGF